MTIICEHCGYENHMDSDNCFECGQMIKKNEEYLICSICGIGNPKSAKTCIGCQEPLNGNTTFVVDTEEKNQEEIEGILSVDAAGVVKPEATKEAPKDFKKIKMILKLFLLGMAALGIFVLSLMWVNNQRIYIEAEEGIHYVTQTGMLHVIDESGNDIEISYDVSSETEVVKYGNHIYYITDQKLYSFEKGLAKLISDHVNSYKVNLKGDMVLYTVSDQDELFGDLYKYDGKETLRIDGHVGINRYIFYDDDVYYVTDITSDENLGVLYMKRGDKSSVKISEDVYTPLFSLKKDSVYFVRKNIDVVDRFDLYYVKSGKVNEISRNIVQLVVNPKEEVFAVVQMKNSQYNLSTVKRDEVTTLETGVDQVGLKSYSEDLKPIVYMDDIKLFMKESTGMNKMYDGQIKELGLFDEFWLSDDQKKVYTVLNNELSYSDLKDTLQNTISLARDAKPTVLSESGEVSVYESLGKKYLVTDSYVNPLNDEVTDTLISMDEKYLIYLEGKDAYVLKSGAKEAVFLGSQVDVLMTINNYVYTIVENELFRYKLGKFSSNKAIDSIRFWDELKLTE
ncbi:MAG: zinc ribbon domain-containing protein [Clostridiales bacterium]|nr:zinc ribbon domain-containing protein [Clostridiales bacterium]